MVEAYRMKRIICALLMLPALAFGDARDIIMMQRNNDDTGQLTRLVTHPPGTSNGILGYAGDLQLPFFFGIGSGLTVTAGVIDAAAQSFSQISGKPTTLAGYGITDGATLTQLATKFTNPAGTIAQYIRGDGSLSTLPAAKRIETYTGTTDANGLITVTYATAYPVTPNVQPGPPPSSDMSWVLVSSTTTGFSIRLVQRATLTVLSLQVLAGTVTNVTGSPARVLVVES
jgi:hypothetical protein